MTRLTRQSVALVQRVFGEHLVGASDGIAGTRTKDAIGDWQEVSRLPTANPGYLSDRQFADLTGCELDPYGDPDYGAYFKANGLACDAHGTPAVGGRFVPQGVIVHHTGAMSVRDRIPADRMIKGRTGLSGPIVQVAVSRDMSVDVITNGRAHHAGTGDSKVLAKVKNDMLADDPDTDDTSGNSWFLGIEVDHSGKATEQHGPQWGKAERVAALWCKLWRWDPQFRVLGHSEWTSRKRDPIYPMSAFEDGVIRAMQAGPPGTPTGDYAVIGGKRYSLVPDD